VFFFEQVRLHDVESGEDRLLLDVADHGWQEAGHFDWDPTGSQLVFAARENGGSFRPQVLDMASGEVTRVPTGIQIIDTVFAADGRILGIDTSGAASQLETPAWVGLDGTVTAITPSEGVNRDPVASPDMRYVANIRATGPLSRVGLGRWDLVINDLTTGEEWTVGDGEDGFGPPRWISDEVLVAKHARYDSEGVIASLPDVVLVDVTTDEITLIAGRTAAWDPDPRR
jgi:Tol biopolymer transport system component